VYKKLEQSSLAVKTGRWRPNLRYGLWVLKKSLSQR
jgi:hypothetical protein